MSGIGSSVLCWDNRSQAGSSLITVVTIVRNGEFEIEDTILSVVRDKPDWLEYIVIDGASTDGTLQVIGKYSKFIDCFVSEADSGIYDAMNKGVSLAGGRCIGLLNSGDIYERGALESVAEWLGQVDAKYFVLAGGVRMVDSLGFQREVFVPGEDVLKRRFEIMPLNHPAMFVSRSVYSDITLYDDSRRVSADYGFTLKILEHGVRVYFMPLVLVKMAAGGVSDSARTLFVRLNESFSIRREYKSFSYCAFVYARELVSFLLRILRNK